MSKTGRPRGRPPKVQRADTYTNVASGVGVALRDKRRAGGYAVECILDLEARDWWRGSDVAARVIEMIPDEEVREGFEVKVADADKDAVESVEARIEELDLSAAWVRARCYERAYGGAAIWPVVNDGASDLSQPLDPRQVDRVRGLVVLEALELQPRTWYGDATSLDFGRPETYWMQRHAEAGVTQVRVPIHESRLVLFPGRRVTQAAVPGARPGWGDSELQRVAPIVRDFDAAYSATAALMSDFAQGVFKIGGLDELVRHDSEGAVKRLLSMDYQRSALRAVVIDDKDDFSRTSTPVSGLPELLDRHAQRLSAATGIPVTRLMGKSPAGLQATGDADDRAFYDLIASGQRSRQRQVERLVWFVLVENAGPFKGQEPDAWCVEWRPLWQASDKEEAERRYLVAQADEIYVKSGVLSPDEVAEQRFGGDRYSAETHVDAAARAALEPTPAEVAAAQAGSAAPTPAVP